MLLKLNRKLQLQRRGGKCFAFLPGSPSFEVPDNMVQLAELFRAPRSREEVQSAFGQDQIAAQRAIDRLQDLAVLVEDDDLANAWPLPSDLLQPEEAAFRKIRRQVSRHTMGRPTLGYALYNAVNYISAGKIQGSIVETGVWRGGNIALCALTLLAADDTNRDIYLFDTFDWNWPEPSAHDTTAAQPSVEQRKIQLQQRKGASDSQLDAELVSEQAVLDYVRSTGYPPDRFISCKGLVQDTLPANAPEKIALLRLDTDFYESTYHELTHLYPRLQSGGILLVDDYPTEHGVVRAVNQYFEELGHRPFFSRIDIQGRIAVKP